MPDDIGRLTAERDAAAKASSEAQAKYDEAKQRSDQAAADEKHAKLAGLPVDENVLDDANYYTTNARADYERKQRDLQAAEGALKTACTSAGVPYPAYVPPPPPPPVTTDTAPPQTLDQQVQDQARDDRFKRMRRDGQRADRGEGPRKGKGYDPNDKASDDALKKIIDDIPPPDPWSPGFTGQKAQPAPPAKAAPQPKTGNKLVDDWNAFISGEMPVDEAKKYRDTLKQNLNEHLLDDATEDHLKAHPELLEDPKSPGQPLPPSPPPSGVGYTPQGGDVAWSTAPGTQPAVAQVGAGAATTDGGGPSGIVRGCLVLVGIFLLVVLGSTGVAYAPHVGPFSPTGSSQGSGAQRDSGAPNGAPTQTATVLTYRSDCVGSCNTENIDTCDNTFDWSWTIQTDPQNYEGQIAVIATTGNGLQPRYQVPVVGGRIKLHAVAPGAAWGGTHANGCYQPGVHWTSNIIKIGDTPTFTPNPPQ